MAWRRRWGVPLLVVTSAILTILVVDVALLVVYGPVRTAENFYVDDPQLGYRMRPDLEFVFASAYHGYCATVRTNSRGLRDDETVVPKPEGTFRVLLLGDSVVGGLEVERDKTMEALCERQLSHHGRIEIINCGVRGYNLDNILAFLESEGLRYEPDLVVYVFVENDVATSATFEPLRGGLAESQRMVIGRRGSEAGETMAGIVGRLACYSHLTFRVELLRQMIVLRRQRDRDLVDPAKVKVPGGLYTLLRWKGSEDPVQFTWTAERIARLAEFATRSGAAFLLAGAPHRVEIEPEAQAWWTRHLATPERPLDFDGIRRFLARTATTHDLSYFDPVPAFRQVQQREGGTFWFHNDGHLTERGHRLFAEQLAQKLERSPAFAWRSSAATGQQP